MKKSDILAFVKKNPAVEYGMDYEIMGDLDAFYSNKLGIPSWSLPEELRRYIDDMDASISDVMNFYLPYHNYQSDMAEKGILDAPRHPNYVAKNFIVDRIKKAVIKVNAEHSLSLESIRVKPVSFNRIINILNKYGTMYMR